MNLCWISCRILVGKVTGINEFISCVPEDFQGTSEEFQKWPMNLELSSRYQILQIYSKVHRMFPKLKIQETFCEVHENLQRNLKEFV